MKSALLALHAKFESVIVSVLLVVMMLVLLIAMGEFLFLMVHGLAQRLREVDSVEFMQSRMHVVFAGVLVILLGLELMETVRMYLTDHVIHVEVVFLVAMIAVGRHIIETDYLQVPATNLFGIAAIVLALAAGYFLLKRSHPTAFRAGPEEEARKEA